MWGVRGPCQKLPPTKPLLLPPAGCLTTHGCSVAQSCVYSLLTHQVPLEPGSSPDGAQAGREGQMVGRQEAETVRDRQSETEPHNPEETE